MNIEQFTSRKCNDDSGIEVNSSPSGFVNIYIHLLTVRCDLDTLFAIIKRWSTSSVWWNYKWIHFFGTRNKTRRRKKTSETTAAAAAETIAITNSAMNCVCVQKLCTVSDVHSNLHVLCFSMFANLFLFSYLLLSWVFSRELLLLPLVLLLLLPWRVCCPAI